ncbi:uncharacterized protein LOC114528635 [Dendronephthya gigantea]|uniref:uncharacterized protein LOC114528635 n=1 Tax=Dendronephthya gigantea TaxID=151771 RepID=UPI00106AC2E0|nr:uncharacterized protein LOC114528635 [Dendronephthya gigantea]
MTSFASILFAIAALSVNCEDIIVPSTENIFEIQHSNVLPMTLKCPFPRHKYIEIRGVTLMNGSDILIASSLAPNIERLSNEECLASLVQTNGKPAKCEVSMNALPQDGSIDHMDKVVTFDCRKKGQGDSSGAEKTISKEKGTINIKCDNKEAVPEIIDISLANQGSVDVVSISAKCSMENIDNMAKGKGGGHCQIKRDGDLNKSKMTVKYKCSEPPKREVEEFVPGNGNKGNGNRGRKK